MIINFPEKTALRGARSAWLDRWRTRGPCRRSVRRVLRGSGSLPMPATVSRPGSIEYRSVYKAAGAKEQQLRLSAVSTRSSWSELSAVSEHDQPTANGQTGLRAASLLPFFSRFLFAEKGFLRTCLSSAALLDSLSKLLLMDRSRCLPSAHALAPPVVLLQIQESM